MHTLSYVTTSNQAKSSYLCGYNVPVYRPLLIKVSRLLISACYFLYTLVKLQIDASIACILEMKQTSKYTVYSIHCIYMYMYMCVHTCIANLLSVDPYAAIIETMISRHCYSEML